MAELIRDEDLEQVDGGRRIARCGEKKVLTGTEWVCTCGRKNKITDIECACGKSNPNLKKA